jgi:two-component system response regulator HupR/HoxA
MLDPHPDGGFDRTTGRVLDSPDGPSPTVRAMTAEPFDYKAYPLLFVDDEPDIVETFRFGYEDAFTIHSTTSGAAALAVLEREPVAVLVTDQRMPEMAGIELIGRALAIRPDVVPIILTGYTDVEALVDAINLGRIHRYVAKPWDHQELGLTLRRAVETYHLGRENARLAVENARLVGELQRANERLTRENRFLRERAADGAGFDAIVGTSEALRRVVATARRVVDSPTTVLLEGPSGTGKELFAKAIHYEGVRSAKLFVAVNCGALSEELLASELFGHRKGAFTGALVDKKGLFETADGGTLFLDEISEASPAVQVHLLRSLQEGEVLPVGATRPVTVDVRVIAATNRDLAAEVERGRFREDLYYRLSVFRLRLPALDEHPGDIPLLAEHFLAVYSRALGRPVPPIAPQALDLLARQRYRGNVRQLGNLIERALIMAEPGRPILPADLMEDGAAPPASATLQEDLARYEREQIARALELTGGNKSRAARHLGITYRGLLKKMQRLGMPTGDAEAED